MIRYNSRFQRLLLLILLKFLGRWKSAKFLQKIKYFKSQGNDCYFQIANFNTEPYLISFGNNVTVATGVKFITHDVIHFVLNNMGGSFEGRKGEIIGNNVFIGANSIILYDVEIGNNAIVAAGSVFTKSIPSNTVVCVGGGTG